MSGTATPLWNWSLHVYRAPGVQQACLALQDGCGADVNLLLFCGWVGSDSRSLDRRRLALAMSRVGPWQSGVVRPLRSARRALKHPGLAEPLDAQAQALRRRLLALELEAEHVEQSLLCELAANWAVPVRPRPPPQVMAANLARYVSLLPVQLQSTDRSHLDVLVSALGAQLTSRPAPCPRRP